MNLCHKFTTDILQEIQLTLDEVDSCQCEALIRQILEAKRIFITGKGRSGLQMRAFAMRLMHLGFSVFVVEETTTPGIAAGDLLLIGSGSGHTASLIQYAHRAKSLAANIALITADAQSEIALLSDVVLEIPAPTPKSERLSGRTSRQPMGSLFEQALGILLDAFILQLMVEQGLDARQMFSRHANLE